MKKLILLLFVLTVSLKLHAQFGAIDHSFNTTDIGYGQGDGANSYVRTSILLPDGKIIIGGSFTTYNATATNRIARVNTDGTLDSTFNPGSGASASIYTTARQPDGKIIIGGYFTSYNGIEKNYIARINADGSLDNSFTPDTGANHGIVATALQPDGKVIIGGDFTDYNGTTRNYIARINADGSLDTTFNPGSGANNTVITISLQSDGKIIIGGDFTIYNGTARNRIARLNADGSLDNTFNPGSGANNTVGTITLQPDGKIMIGGYFTTYNGTARNRIARLNADGLLDFTFNPGSGTNNPVESIKLLSDGKYIIAGDFTTYNGITRNSITGINADGTLDNTFNTGYGADYIINTTAVQPDGKIIIGGYFTTYNATARNRFARLKANGSLDSTFNSVTGANAQIYSTTLQPDGKIIIAGGFKVFNGEARRYFTRLNDDGSLDYTYFSPGTGTNDNIYTTALQPDGKIIIGGKFTTCNGPSRNRIARLNSDFSLDNTFNPGTGADNDVYTVALQPDGRIIIGGSFYTYNGTTRIRIARLNNGGLLDNTFTPGSGANNNVETITLLPDGKIIIGGLFTTYNNISRNRIARLNTDGSLDTTFNPGTGANNNVYITALQPDGKIIIGGYFTTYNGYASNYIARLNADGSLDNTFNPGSGADNSVKTITLQPDGKIIIGGLFSTYNGITRNRLARLNADGSLDVSFDPGTGANNNVYTTLIQPDGKIIFGGLFTSYNNTGRNRIARLLNCSIATGTDVQTSCTSFTWIDGNTYTSDNNTATYNIIGGAASGCDSLVTLNLNITAVDTLVTLVGNTLTANASGASYQWLDCDNAYAVIPGENSQTYAPAVTGNYAVAISQNTCTDTSSCYNTILTGVYEINADDDLLIFPNPFSSQTTLHLQHPLNSATLTIDNIFGQTLVKMRDINGQTVTIHRNNLAPGLYFIRLIEGNKQIVMKKIIITD